MSYPFSDGISVFVERNSSDLASYWAGPSRAVVSVHLHHETKGAKAGDTALPALQVVGKVSDGLVPGPQPGDALMSWLLKQPTSQSDDAVGRAMGEVLVAQRSAAQGALADLTRLKTITQFLDDRPLWLSLTRSFADGTLSDDLLLQFGSVFLRLPWQMVKLARGSAFMELVRAEAVERASGKGAARGYALEVATIADQWIAAGDPQRRFIFFNCYMLGKDQQPEREFDVVRVDLFADRTWAVTAVECAVARTERKDGEGREKLELLRSRLQGRFSDLKSFTTLFSEPGEQGRVSYEDAGRGFTTGH